MLTLRAEAATPAPPPKPRSTAVLKALTVPVENAMTGLSIRARAHGKVGKTVPRGAVLTFQFYDQHGMPLDVPHAGFTYSSGLARRFQYVSVGDSTVAATKTRPLFPPLGAAQLELHLQRWSGMDKVALVGELSVEPVEYVLSDLPKLEATDSESAERLAWHWLSIHGKERQYLLEIQAFAWRIGAASLLREACLRLEHAPEVRGYMRQQANLSLAALDELSDWLPVAPHTDRADHHGLAHVVAHLVPNVTAGDVGVLTQTQYEQGLKPLLIAPTEYSTQARPSDPYTQVEHDGVQQITLHPLAAQAHAQVRRTDLLRLDTLLTAQFIASHRVGLIHAHVGRSGYDLALRALALGQQYRIPVVMQWHDPESACPVGHAMSPPPASEWQQHADAQQLRCSRRADAVLVGDAWQAELLRRAGVHSDKLFIAPPPLSLSEEDVKHASPANSAWSAYVDVTALTAEQTAALMAAIPAAMTLPGLTLHVAGPQSVVAQIESAVLEARNTDEAAPVPASIKHVQTGPAKGDVVIRLRPVKSAMDSSWLSDLDELLRQDSLVLAQSTPESDCLVRDGQRGLTFNLGDQSDFAQALAALAPTTDTATQLRNKHSGLLQQRSLDAYCQILESAYRYAIQSPG